MANKERLIAFSAVTPNKANKNINVASLVPKPLTVIGIKPTIVAIGVIVT